MQALLDVILPVFLVLGMGYFAVRLKWFKDDWIEGLMKFAQTFGIPLLLFRSVSRMDLAQDFDLGLLASFYIGAFSGFLAACFGARFLFNRPWQDSVAIGFVGLFSNSVLLGLPIAERAWGAQVLPLIFTIIAFHSPFCYAIGISAMEMAKNSEGGIKAALPRIFATISRNVFVLAIVAGFAVNLTVLVLPVAVTDAVDMLARAALPIALFALGGTLNRYRPEGNIGLILYVTGVSLLVHPIITYALARGFDLSDNALRAAIACSAMAPGINAFIFANMYGVARRIAASTILVGTALTMLTAWVWLTILP